MSVADIFERYDYPLVDKLNNFDKFASQTFLARFMARYELFQRVLTVKGSIVECGVRHGGGPVIGDLDQSASDGPLPPSGSQEEAASAATETSGGPETAQGSAAVIAGAADEDEEEKPRTPPSETANNDNDDAGQSVSGPSEPPHAANDDEEPRRA